MPRTCIAMIASLAILALAGCTAGDRLGAADEAGALAAREQQALELSRSGNHGAARKVYLSMAGR